MAHHPVRPRRRLTLGPIALFGLAVLLLVLLPADAAHAQTASICAFDMGSNSFRRIVGSFAAGRYVQPRIEKKTLSVGDDVARHGRISDPKLAEIRATLAAFKATCEKEGITRVMAVGTAAFRDAPNGRRVVEIAKALGIPMEIATETRESELAYLVGSLGQDGYAVIDNGSRSIELVSREKGAMPHLVFNLGYRMAYEKFFAKASDPAGASRAFQAELRTHVAKAGFMKGRKKLVGVEFAEMVEVLFEPKTVEGRIFTLAELQRKLSEITAGGASGFQALKKKPDIDRALPRLVAAVTLVEAFGYSQLELTERELGTGLIIEAGITQR